MAKTNFQDVYIDNKGQFYYEVSLGNDKITGKRIKKKARKDINGKKFATAKEAYTEAIRVKNDYLQSDGYSNYDMTYEQYMNTVYLPYYQSEVSEHTFSTRQPSLKLIIQRFRKKKLKDISIREVQNFRTWLLSKNGGNYSQAYASLIFGTFRKSLDFAVNLQYLQKNVSLKVKAIPKGKASSQFWTKQDFEKVIGQICIDDFYEHLCFVLLWLYFCTGLRVNEGTALWWNNIDFDKKQLTGHCTLIMGQKKKHHLCDQFSVLYRRSVI